MVVQKQHASTSRTICEYNFTIHLNFIFSLSFFFFAQTILDSFFFFFLNFPNLLSFHKSRLLQGVIFMSVIAPLDFSHTFDGNTFLYPLRVIIFFPFESGLLARYNAFMSVLAPLNFGQRCKYIFERFRENYMHP